MVETFSIEPEAFSVFIFHAVVISHIVAERSGISVISLNAPPFRGDPLWAFGRTHPMLPPTPAEENWRAIGYGRHHLDWQRLHQQLHWPGRAAGRTSPVLTIYFWSSRRRYFLACLLR